MRLAELFERLVERAATRLDEPIHRLANRRFYHFPFGDAPRASSDTYMRIWKAEVAREYPTIDHYEREAGYAVDRDWFHRLALITQVVIKKSDVCYQHGRLLYSSLSRYAAQNPNRSLTILETGTARGFSTLCMAKALSDAGRSAKVITFDVLPHRVKMFWNCIADEHGPQTRAELLGKYKPLIEEYVIFHEGDTRLELGKVDVPRVDFAFLDSTHTYDCVMYEFAYLKSRQSEGDIVFFDDYTPMLFPGVAKAVDEICEKHGYSKRVIRLSDQRGYVIARKN